MKICCIRLCLLVVDACGSEPCENGGVCIPEGNSYSCRCLQPYHGKHCKAGMSRLDILTSCNSTIILIYNPFTTGHYALILYHFTPSNDQVVLFAKGRLLSLIGLI